MLGPILESERIQVGPPRLEHLSTFIRWFADPAVTRYLLRRYPPTLKQEQDWLESMAASERDIVWAVTLRESGAVIGVTSLQRIDWRNRHAWIEISIGERAQWGQGYATETIRLCTGYGFEELGLEKILASVYSGNDASLRILDKACYRRAGLLRHHCFFGGEWHDEWLGEILREEWKDR